MHHIPFKGNQALERQSIMKKHLAKSILLLFVLLALACPASAREDCATKAADIIYPAPQQACLGQAARLAGIPNFSAQTDAFTQKAADHMIAAFQILGIKPQAARGNVLQINLLPNTEVRNGAFRDEGYSIEIPASGAPITVRANSETGFIYAALTLGQLVHTGADGAPAIYTGTVDDYPAFAFRGVLEGGYEIWQHENRSDVLRWMGPIKMNYFIYAPKEDPYFRRQWRKPFPQEELDKYREYIAICDEYNIIFAFSMSPALNMEYSSDQEFQTLVAKYRQIQDLGVVHFGIFFDDVLPFLSTPADQARFEHIAEAEALVTNRLLEFLRKNDPSARLFFVPNQYWGWTPTKYWEIISRDLNPEIEIGWTGIDIVSKEITVAHAEKFKETVGRYPAIGDNYSPLYALARREAGLYKTASSFVNNPYDFAEDELAQLSKFVDATVGDYAWNPEGYDPDRSLFEATQRIVGGGEDHTRALLLALRIGYSHRASQIQSAWYKDIKAATETLAQAPAGKLPAQAEALEKKIHTMLARIRELKGIGMNPLMYGQLEPILWKADEMLSTARMALDPATVAKKNPDSLAAEIKNALKM
jgi:hyaluronoglucosaminidase